MIFFEAMTGNIYKSIYRTIKYLNNCALSCKYFAGPLSTYEYTTFFNVFLKTEI